MKQPSDKDIKRALKALYETGYISGSRQQFMLNIRYFIFGLVVGAVITYFILGGTQ